MEIKGTIKQMENFVYCSAKHKNWLYKGKIKYCRECRKNKVWVELHYEAQ